MSWVTSRPGGGTDSSVPPDLDEITDEELLKQLWQQAEDFSDRRRIRARMYKLREKRLREMVQNDEESLGALTMTDDGDGSYQTETHTSDAQATQRKSSLEVKLSYKEESSASDSTSRIGQQSMRGVGSRRDEDIIEDRIREVSKGRGARYQQVLSKYDDKNEDRSSSSRSSYSVQSNALTGDSYQSIKHKEVRDSISPIRGAFDRRIMGEESETTFTSDEEVALKSENESITSKNTSRDDRSSVKSSSSRKVTERKTSKELNLSNARRTDKTSPTTPTRRTPGDVTPTKTAIKRQIGTGTQKESQVSTSKAKQERKAAVSTGSRSPTGKKKTEVTSRSDKSFKTEFKNLSKYLNENIDLDDEIIKEEEEEAEDEHGNIVKMIIQTRKKKDGTQIISRRLARAMKIVEKESDIDEILVGNPDHEVLERDVEEREEKDGSKIKIITETRRRPDGIEYTTKNVLRTSKIFDYDHPEDIAYSEHDELISSEESTETDDQGIAIRTVIETRRKMDGVEYTTKKVYKTSKVDATITPSDDDEILDRKETEEKQSDGTIIKIVIEKRRTKDGQEYTHRQIYRSRKLTLSGIEVTKGMPSMDNDDEVIDRKEKEELDKNKRKIKVVTETRRRKDGSTYSFEYVLSSFKATKSDIENLSIDAASNTSNINVSNDDKIIKEDVKEEVQKDGSKVRTIIERRRAKDGTEYLRHRIMKIPKLPEPELVMGSLDDEVFEKDIKERVLDDGTHCKAITERRRSSTTGVHYTLRRMSKVFQHHAHLSLADEIIDENATEEEAGNGIMVKTVIRRYERPDGSVYTTHDIQKSYKNPVSVNVNEYEQDELIDRSYDERESIDGFIIKTIVETRCRNDGTHYTIERTEKVSKLGDEVQVSFRGNSISSGSPGDTVVSYEEHEEPADDGTIVKTILEVRKRNDGTEYTNKITIKSTQVLVPEHETSYVIIKADPKDGDECAFFPSLNDEIVYVRKKKEFDEKGNPITVVIETRKSKKTGEKYNLTKKVHTTDVVMTDQGEKVLAKRIKKDDTTYKSKPSDKRDDILRSKYSPIKKEAPKTSQTRLDTTKKASEDTSKLSSTKTLTSKRTPKTEYESESVNLSSLKRPIRQSPSDSKPQEKYSRKPNLHDVKNQPTDKRGESPVVKGKLTQSNSLPYSKSNVVRKSPPAKKVERSSDSSPEHKSENDSSARENLSRTAKQKYDLSSKSKRPVERVSSSPARGRSPVRSGTSTPREGTPIRQCCQRSPEQISPKPKYVSPVIRKKPTDDKPKINGDVKRYPKKIESEKLFKFDKPSSRETPSKTQPLKSGKIYSPRDVDSSKTKKLFDKKDNRLAPPDDLLFNKEPIISLPQTPLTEEMKAYPATSPYIEDVSSEPNLPYHTVHRPSLVREPSEYNPEIKTDSLLDDYLKTDTKTRTFEAKLSEKKIDSSAFSSSEDESKRRDSPFKRYSSIDKKSRSDEVSKTEELLLDKKSSPKIEKTRDYAPTSLLSQIIPDKPKDSSTKYARESKTDSLEADTKSSFSARFSIFEKAKPESKDKQPVCMAPRTDNLIPVEEPLIVPKYIHPLGSDSESDEPKSKKVVKEDVNLTSTRLVMSAIGSSETTRKKSDSKKLEVEEENDIVTPLRERSKSPFSKDSSPRPRSKEGSPAPFIKEDSPVRFVTGRPIDQGPNTTKIKRLERSNSNKKIIYEDLEINATNLPTYLKDIEYITDTTVLEKLLEKAETYEERRIIRGHIRTLKKVDTNVSKSSSTPAYKRFIEPSPSRSSPGSSPLLSRRTATSTTSTSSDYRQTDTLSRKPYQRGERKSPPPRTSPTEDSKPFRKISQPKKKRSSDESDSSRRSSVDGLAKSSRKSSSEEVKTFSETRTSVRSASARERKISPIENYSYRKSSPESERLRKKSPESTTKRISQVDVTINRKSSSDDRTKRDVTRKTSREDTIRKTSRDDTSRKSSRDDTSRKTSRDDTSRKTSRDDTIRKTSRDDISRKTSRDDATSKSLRAGVTRKTSRENVLKKTSQDETVRRTSRENKITTVSLEDSYRKSSPEDSDRYRKSSPEDSYRYRKKSPDDKPRKLSPESKRISPERRSTTRKVSDSTTSRKSSSEITVVRKTSGELETSTKSTRATSRLYTRQDSDEQSKKYSRKTSPDKIVPESSSPSSKESVSSKPVSSSPFSTRRQTETKKTTTTATTSLKTKDSSDKQSFMEPLRHQRTVATAKIEQSNVDKIVSPYGVGPTDEYGLPIIGLKALKRRNQQNVPEEAPKPKTPEKEFIPSDSQGRPLFGIRALKKAPETTTFTTTQMAKESTAVQESLQNASLTTETSHLQSGVATQPVTHTRETSPSLVKSVDMSLRRKSSITESDENEKPVCLRDIIKLHESKVVSETSETKETPSLLKPKKKLRDSFEPTPEHATETRPHRTWDLEADFSTRSQAMENIIAKHETLTKQESSTKTEKKLNGILKKTSASGSHPVSITSTEQYDFSERREDLRSSSRERSLSPSKEDEEKDIKMVERKTSYTEIKLSKPSSIDGDESKPLRKIKGKIPAEETTAVTERTLKTDVQTERRIHSKSENVKLASTFVATRKTSSTEQSSRADIKSTISSESSPKPREKSPTAKSRSVDKRETSSTSDSGLKPKREKSPTSDSGLKPKREKSPTSKSSSAAKREISPTAKPKREKSPTSSSLVSKRERSSTSESSSKPKREKSPTYKPEDLFKVDDRKDKTSFDNKKRLNSTSKSKVTVGRNTNIRQQDTVEESQSITKLTSVAHSEERQKIDISQKKVKESIDRDSLDGHSSSSRESSPSSSDSSSESSDSVKISSDSKRKKSLDSKKAQKSRKDSKHSKKKDHKTYSVESKYTAARKKFIEEKVDDKVVKMKPKKVEKITTDRVSERDSVTKKDVSVRESSFTRECTRHTDRERREDMSVDHVMKEKKFSPERRTSSDEATSTVIKQRPHIDGRDKSPIYKDVAYTPKSKSPDKRTSSDESPTLTRKIKPVSPKSDRDRAPLSSKTERKILRDSPSPDRRTSSDESSPSFTKRMKATIVTSIFPKLKEAKPKDAVSNTKKERNLQSDSSPERKTSSDDSSKKVTKTTREKITSKEMHYLHSDKSNAEVKLSKKKPITPITKKVTSRRLFVDESQEKSITDLSVTKDKEKLKVKKISPERKIPDSVSRIDKTLKLEKRKVSHDQTMLTEKREKETPSERRKYSPTFKAPEKPRKEPREKIKSEVATSEIKVNLREKEPKENHKVKKIPEVQAEKSKPRDKVATNRTEKRKPYTEDTDYKSKEKKVEKISKTSSIVKVDEDKDKISTDKRTPKKRDSQDLVEVRKDSVIIDITEEKKISKETKEKFIKPNQNADAKDECSVVQEKSEKDLKLEQILSMTTEMRSDTKREMLKISSAKRTKKETTVEDPARKTVELPHQPLIQDEKLCVQVEIDQKKSISKGEDATSVKEKKTKCEVDLVLEETSKIFDESADINVEITTKTEDHRRQDDFEKFRGKEVKEEFEVSTASKNKEDKLSKQTKIKTTESSQLLKTSVVKDDKQEDKIEKPKLAEQSDKINLKEKSEEIAADETKSVSKTFRASNEDKETVDKQDSSKSKKVEKVPLKTEPNREDKKGRKSLKDEKEISLESSISKAEKIDTRVEIKKHEKFDEFVADKKYETRKSRTLSDEHQKDLLVIQKSDTDVYAKHIDRTIVEDLSDTDKDSKHPAKSQSDTELQSKKTEKRRSREVRGYESSTTSITTDDEKVNKLDKEIKKKDLRKTSEKSKSVQKVDEVSQEAKHDKKVFQEAKDKRKEDINVSVELKDIQKEDRKVKQEPQETQENRETSQETKYKQKEDIKILQETKDIDKYGLKSKKIQEHTSSTTSITTDDEKNSKRDEEIKQKERKITSQDSKKITQHTVAQETKVKQKEDWRGSQETKEIKNKEVSRSTTSITTDDEKNKNLDERSKQKESQNTSLEFREATQQEVRRTSQEIAIKQEDKRKTKDKILKEKEIEIKQEDEKETRDKTLKGNETLQDTKVIKQKVEVFIETKEISKRADKKEILRTEDKTQEVKEVQKNKDNEKSSTLAKDTKQKDIKSQVSGSDVSTKEKVLKKEKDVVSKKKKDDIRVGHVFCTVDGRLIDDKISATPKGKLVSEPDAELVTIKKSPLTKADSAIKDKPKDRTRDKFERDTVINKVPKNSPASRFSKSPEPEEISRRLRKLSKQRKSSIEAMENISDSLQRKDSNARTYSLQSLSAASTTSSVPGYMRPKGESKSHKRQTPERDAQDVEDLLLNSYQYTRCTKRVVKPPVKYDYTYVINKNEGAAGDSKDSYSIYFGPRDSAPTPAKLDDMYYNSTKEESITSSRRSSRRTSVDTTASTQKYTQAEDEVIVKYDIEVDDKDILRKTSATHADATSTDKEDKSLDIKLDYSDVTSKDKEDQCLDIKLDYADATSTDKEDKYLDIKLEYENKIKALGSHRDDSPSSHRKPLEGKTYQETVPITYKENDTYSDIRQQYQDAVKSISEESSFRKSSYSGESNVKESKEASDISYIKYKELVSKDYKDYGIDKTSSDTFVTTDLRSKENLITKSPEDKAHLTIHEERPTLDVVNVKSTVGKADEDRRSSYEYKASSAVEASKADKCEESVSKKEYMSNADSRDSNRTDVIARTNVIARSKYLPDYDYNKIYKDKIEKSSKLVSDSQETSVSEHYSNTQSDTRETDNFESYVTFDGRIITQPKHYPSDTKKADPAPGIVESAKSSPRETTQTQTEKSSSATVALDSSTSAFRSVRDTSTAVREQSSEFTSSDVTRGQGRSFLEDRTKVSGISDVLSRMGASEAVDHESKITSDDQARSLLNKFLGAQVLMTGVESMMANASTSQASSHSSMTRGSDGNVTVTRNLSEAQATKTMKDGDFTENRKAFSSGPQTISYNVSSSASPKVEGADIVKGVNINEVTDDFALNQLLDSCEEYDERRRVRMRLKALMAEKKELQKQLSGHERGDYSSSRRTAGVSGSNLRTSEGTTSSFNFSRGSQVAAQKSSFSSSYSTQNSKSFQSSSENKNVSALDKFKNLDSPNISQSQSVKGPPLPGPLFQLSTSLSRSASGVKDMILTWCQCRTRDYQGVKIENFSTSWNDGMAFCALIHHFYPDAFDFKTLDPKNRRQNFALAFRVADEKAGIMPLLDVDDMVMMKKPDWKCVFTYVQSLYKRLKDE